MFFPRVDFGFSTGTNRVEIFTHQRQLNIRIYVETNEKDLPFLFNICQGEKMIDYFEQKHIHLTFALSENHFYLAWYYMTAGGHRRVFRDV